MNPTKNKMKGLKNKAMGTIKEKIGKTIGNPKLEAKGAIEKTKGQLQSAMGDMQRVAKSNLKKLEESSKRA